MSRRKIERTDFYHMKVTALEAADFLGLPERTFYRFVEQGIIPKVDDGEYVLGEVSKAYWLSQFEGKGLTVAKTRLTMAKAELKELELAEEKGKFVRASIIEKTWANNVSNAKSKLLAIPSKISRELVGQDEKIIEAKLKREIYEALRELAEYDEKQISRITKQSKS